MKNKKTLFYVLLILLLIIFFIGLFLIVRYNRSKRLEKDRESIFVEEGDSTETEVCCVDDMLRGVRLQEEIEGKYPWYSEFPIERDEYVVVWVSEREQFRSDLKLPSSSGGDMRNDVVGKAVRSIEKVIKEKLARDKYYFRFLDKQ
jgi:hypothetical protein